MVSGAGQRCYITANGEFLPVTAQVWAGPGGSPLRLEPSVAALPWARGLTGRPWSLWRYAEALPFARESTWPARVTMGEGMTGLVDLEVGGARLMAKLEYAMPTGSFKDRGAAVLVAKAAELGVERVIVDSSGNAGVAIAAYAARVGVSCEVVVPSSASPAKLVAAEAHGAVVRRVEGSRQEVAEAARRRVLQEGAWYASHVVNPFFLEGTKTFAFEVWEQLGAAPEAVVLPAGNGTYVLGVAQGFAELRAAGLIDRLPTLHAVQAAACAPLAVAWSRRERSPAAVEPRPTAAEGIAIAAPPRGAEILAVLHESGGRIVAVDEVAIASHHRALARQGLFVEPTAAATIAGCEVLAHDGVLDGRVVVPLCGTGLK